MNILNCLLEVPLVTNEPVTILPVPNRSEGALHAIPQVIANLTSRKFLPRRHDLCDCPSMDWLEKDMHVIRHYNPRQQAVTL